MTQAPRSRIDMRQRTLTRNERRLSNQAYRKFLYEKYQVVFSVRELCFLFNGESYPKAEPLMQRLHRLERAEVRLTFYVLAIFLILLCFVMTGVNAIDSYVQSVQ